MTAGACLKEDNGRIYEHSDNESQLSMTILNLVRGRMRGAVSGGQVGRFNATVPQRNCKISPPRTGCRFMERGSCTCLHFQSWLGLSAVQHGQRGPALTSRKGSEVKQHRSHCREAQQLSQRPRRVRTLPGCCSPNSGCTKRLSSKTQKTQLFEDITLVLSSGTEQQPCTSLLPQP